MQFTTSLTGILEYLPDSPLVVLLAAVIPYCAAMGAHYYHHTGSKHHDAFLVCGTTSGAVMGWTLGLNFQQVLFRALPGVILLAMLVHSCYSRLR